jgi:Tfp pilus assembly protein PilV
MQKLKNQNGFSVIEATLAVLLLAAIGVAGYFAYQAQHNNSNNQPLATTKTTITSKATTTTKPANEFDITPWEVKMTLPAGLSGLSYTLDTPGTTATFISAQLKGQPSSCTGQSTTTGELGTITSSTAAPTSDFPGVPIPADLERKVGSTYYRLTLPNGSSCQSSSSLTTTETNQTQLLQQAFQTL